VIHHHNIISSRGDMSGEVPMAMLPRLWSLNGLAVELRLDRRTVARKLAKIPPDGRLDKGHGWYLATALPVLVNGGSAPVEDYDIVERNPVDSAWPW
jgi:hypothetical protein